MGREGIVDDRIQSIPSTLGASIGKFRVYFFLHQLIKALSKFPELVGLGTV